MRINAARSSKQQVGTEDTELFNRIYDDYHRQMEYVAYEVLQNRQDAEDAVQDAFLALSAHLDTLKNMEDFRIYYYVTETARNKAIDLLRKRKYSLSYDEIIERTDDSEDFTDRIAAKDAADEMLEYIRQLPEHYREVLSLSYVNELNSKQIAEILGRSDTTVRKQLQRGREILLKRWKEKHHD
ncbi:MAG: RNA polymerase sigma factor [Eubacteriales bacterium]